MNPFDAIERLVARASQFTDSHPVGMTVAAGAIGAILVLAVTAGAIMFFVACVHLMYAMATGYIEGL